MYIYIHTFIHTYIHACIHTYRQTYIHTYIRLQNFRKIRFSATCQVRTVFIVQVVLRVLPYFVASTACDRSFGEGIKGSCTSTKGYLLLCRNIRECLHFRVFLRAKGTYTYSYTYILIFTDNTRMFNNV